MKDAWWVTPKELNGEQRDVINLPPDGSYLVTGPPGCGKTNLLLLRANYLTMRAHANVLIIVFTRTLQEFIRTGAQQYAFPASSVVTSRSWAAGLLREHGTDPNVAGTFSEQRKQLLDKLSSLITDKNFGHIYDAIFLDEAQDYLVEEVDLFRRLTSRLFAVADTRQRIYDVADPLESLKKMTDAYIPLKYHYRCGRRICLAADSLRRGDYSYDPLEETFQYDEVARPSTVDSNKLATLDEVADLVLERLRVQVQAYPDELLGIVAPKREDAEYVGQRILASELGPFCVVQTSTDYISFNSKTSICICSLHAAKGLEFRALHLVGCEKFPLFRDRQKRMSYTAITRAKTSLQMYSVEPLPGYLAQAVYDANPAPEPPALEDIFRGRK